MKTATLKQTKKILVELMDMLEDVPAEQIRELLEGGYISGLLKANVAQMNHDDFQNLCGLTLAPSGFCVWKTIKLGIGPKTADNFQRILNGGRFHTSVWAEDILKSPDFRVTSRKINLQLVKCRTRGLGFKIGARRSNIYAKAKEYGLEICPSEAGPQLRLQYENQPDGEVIFIAMEPNISADGGQRLFSLYSVNSELWLDGCHGDPDAFWDPNTRWVFVRPRRFLPI